MWFLKQTICFQALFSNFKHI